MASTRIEVSSTGSRRHRRLRAGVATVLSAGLGAGAAASATPQPKVKTTAGVFLITGTLIADRFPPGCRETDFPCELSHPGYRVLIVWLKRQPGAKPGKLQDASKGVRVQASNGAKAK